MKGKVLNLKILMVLLISLTAGFCFAFGVISKTGSKHSAYAAHSIATLDNEDYSALLGGNVVLSVEKVAVSSGMTNNIPDSLVGGKTFMANYDDGATGEKYTFQDIENGKNNKTVVEDGKFVKLDNIYDGSKFIVEGNAGVQEALMISFGAYIFKPAENQVSEDVLTNSTGFNAGITYLEVVLTKNGVKQTIPSNRNITTADGGLYFDFAYLITQQDDNSNEGYYQISVRYMVDYVERTASFEFYMVNNRSYEQSINPEDQDYGYNAKPTLGWSGGTEFSKTNSSNEVDGYYRYFIGKDGILTGESSYPTITYDYSRYKLSYVVTANQKIANYDVDVVYNNTLGKTTAKLVLRKTIYGETSSTEYELKEYDPLASTNLVTIMLTEPGSYVISYEYLYKGYNSANAPATGFVSKDIKLAIHGMSLLYSKANYASAKMQYFEIATDASNNIDLVVPNGYDINKDISNLKNQQLGFVYSLVESDKREGNILLGNDINSLINTNLINKNLESKTYYNFLTAEDGEELNLTNINKYESIKDDLKVVLSNISYAQTNQGSLWLEGNDQFEKDSFYFYSPNRFESADDLFEVEDDVAKNSKSEDYTNITSFNSKGYYLVFIKINPNGINTDAESYKYWQVFAFQYTSTSTNINVEAIDTKNTQDTIDDTFEVVAGGKFTNKNVRISWKKPGIFDRNITPNYYSVINQNISKEQLIKTKKNALTYTERDVDGEIYCFATLGSEVENGTFVKYLIHLENEGDSATYKIFTIDRQDISGIMAYLIREMYSGTLVYYSYATTSDNSFIPISNSITDSYATITWNDKASGADISASYNFTPFAISNKASNEMETISGKNGKSWMTTNYQLGNTISGADLYKAESEYNVSTECILFNQGIYIITLKDSAGNEADYAFVIDKTTNYFKVEGTYLSNNSAIYGNDVNYEVGDYKVFELSTTNSILSEFIEKASTEGNLTKFKNYYTGSGNNISALSKLFQTMNGKYYLTVKNNSVIGFENNASSGKNLGLKGMLEYFDEDGSTYYTCKLYVKAENHTFSTGNVVDRSYALVEINHDNARGYVYYSNTSDFGDIPRDGAYISNNGMIHKLQTGSDGETVNGLLAANATSAQNLAFIWKMGTGNFEVAEVSYTFYSLKPNTFNTQDNGKYYFYGSGEHYEIYKEGNFQSANASAIGSGLAMMLFNGSNQTKAGLYKVTRRYKEIENSELLGQDVATKNYYFIVDRNGIIDVTAGIGGSIKIDLMENETEFLEFSTHGLDANYLTYRDEQITVDGERYYIYLETNKLPATLNIPVGKYFDGKNTSADYYAGRLNISVYFHDTDNQLPLESGYRGKTLKIYQSNGSDEITNETFAVDIYKYLSDVSLSARNRLTISGDSGNWLFLPGNYIVRITDNVVDGNGTTHVKNIGFRITGYKNEGPAVDTYTGYGETRLTEDVFAGYSKDNMIEIIPNLIDTAQDGAKYSATVSQEFLEVRLKTYDYQTTNAQVDPNYLLVTQYYGAQNSLGTAYIDHKYGIGVDKVYSEKAILNQDGSISVLLDTKLIRNADDSINTESLSIPLYYTITVRYKLNDIKLSDYNNSIDIDELQKYKDCYVYYSNDKKYNYYESTYTISIDREAPSANISELNKNDNLVEDYNTLFETNEMLENGVHDSGSNLYFTKQYAKYYQEERADKGHIYAYQIDETTFFDKTDVSKVYVKLIKDLSSYNLNLPLVNLGDYIVNSYDSFGNYYSELSTLQPNNYYEIIEQDFAGNTTQYVVHYCPASAEIVVPTTIQTTLGKLQSNVNLASEEVYNVYNITSTGPLSSNQNFFKLEINRLNSTNAFTSLVTSTTDLNALAQSLVKAIQDEKEGNLSLVITTRTSTIKTQINLYDTNNIKSLNVEDLVIKRGEGDYIIDLDAANKQNDAKTLWYFATHIKVQTPSGDLNFVGEIIENEVRYYLVNNDGSRTEYAIWECDVNTTYHIIMTDILGEPHKWRFNTSGYEFVTLTFDNPGNSYESDDGGSIVYYAYTSATLKYDKLIYTGVVSKKVGGVYEPDKSIEINTTDSTIYNIIRLEAPFNQETGAGGIYEYKIDLYDSDENIEQTKFITIDTRLSNVVIRDYATGEQRDIVSYFNNTSYNSENIDLKNPVSGIMNLQWDEIEENDYFDYTYTLFELLKDNTYRKSTFEKTEDGKYQVTTYQEKNGQFELISNLINDGSNTVISTMEDSLGVYMFEIAVFGKLDENSERVYLGNRIYAFEVHASSNKTYYVTGMEKPNSTFKVSELSSELRTKITTKFNTINTNLNLPLYVTNQDLEVVVADVNVDSSELIVVENGQYYDFTIYQLKKVDAYEIYLGILKFKDTNKLVEGVKVVSESTLDVGEQTSFTVAGLKSTNITIQATRKNALKNDYLFNKNKLLLEISYANEHVGVEEFDNVYDIKGNGAYLFKFKDLAGNVHLFENESEELDVYVLREIVLLVNDQQVVNNAYYNDEVSLTIVESSKYVTGSIKITAKRNGSEYKPSGHNPYVFSDYGTYRVHVTAKYKDIETPLTKTITFTIINVDEARKSIDLTGLGECQITNVTNQYGDNITNEFIDMMGSSYSGLNIMYENIMEKSESLKVTSGKQKFNLVYQVVDGIYPMREISVSFTLNNEDAQIACSLKKGESTTKGFTIRFNAAVIYEKVGESYIYINNKIVAHITEASSNSEQKYVTTYDNSGDGDFYVKLVSSSGVVLDSYKVTIKEPLNFWAIVVIIVVVAVVSTVVITIVVLRRKMRIR